MKVMDRRKTRKGVKRSLRCGLCFGFFFLITFLPFFGNNETWTQRPEIVPKRGEAEPAGKKPEAPRVIEQKEPQDESWALIAEKNLFSPERKDFPRTIVEVPKEVKKPSLVRPQVTLYGITIAEDYQSATLGLAGRVLRKGERELMTLLPGERIGEYKLAKVLSDRITLEAQEDSFEVLLYDSKAPKNRVFAKTENNPTTVTSALTGTTPPAAGPKSSPAGREGEMAIPAGAISGRVMEAQVPMPVTPALTPRSRRRL